MASLICVGLLLAGCTSVEERLELRKPTARLVGVTFREATPRAATLVFDVELQNYYPETVPVVGLKYSVSSAGRMFLSGSAEARVNLPANSRKVVALPVSIDYLEVLKILSAAKPGAVIPYAAELDLTVQTPRLGPVLLPLAHRGDLTLPAISISDPQ
jgi:LEA14-like dessication related protein